MRALLFAILGAAWLTASAAACTCRLNPGAPGTIDPISTQPGFSPSSIESPRGATLSFGAPSAWDAVPTSELEGSLIARRDSAPSGATEFYTNLSVVVPPREGRELLEYARAHKCALENQGGSAIAERKLELGVRDAYELVVQWGGSNPHTMIELIEVFGEEVFLVRCAMAPDELESTRGLCSDIFGTFSIQAP